MKNLLAKFKFGEANLQFDFRLTKLQRFFNVFSQGTPNLGVFYELIFLIDLPTFIIMKL